MKCWVLAIRSFRSRCFLYIVTVLFIIYLFKVFQSKKSLNFKSIFYNFPFLDGSRFFFRHSHGNKSKFIPGKFLRTLTPSNESYCSFRLGFPDFFDLSDSEIDLSPELGEQGSYRVIYNVLQGTWIKNQTNNITYCSHLTPDFLYYLVEIVIRWEGPISIAAFVPSYDASITLCLLQRLCFCVPEMSKVSLHFVFPLEYPPDHLACDSVLSIPPGCAIPNIILNKRLITFRNKEELTYPVNVARNVARISANTKFVLVSDIELIPSKNLVSRFHKMVPKLHLKINSGKTFMRRLVYVLPVFEIEDYISNIPEKKSELLDLYSQNKAIYFHRWICLHCQRFPGLQRWIHQTSYATDNSIQVCN
ncbi:hypothetical protein J6590_009562 [Homalodisca vitripennis]|nr:hypothetical protein J6590_009562 [Homalodisca vitripennis]